MIKKLTEIKRCIENRRFSIQPRAADSLRLDGLTPIDLEAAILSGELTARYGSHGAGCRYVVTGETTSGEKLDVLCRFSSGRHLTILGLDGQGSAHSFKRLNW